MEYLLDERDSSAHKKAVDLLLSYGYKANLIQQNGELSLIDSGIEKEFELKSLESDNIVFCK